MIIVQLLMNYIHLNMLVSHTMIELEDRYYDLIEITQFFATNVVVTCSF